MVKHLVGFSGSIMAMPFVAQLEPDGVISKLAVGSAQVILAIVVVCEALAIIRMFQMWRAEVEESKKDTKLDRDELMNIVKLNAEASTRASTSMSSLEGSIKEFAEVIRGCKQK